MMYVYMAIVIAFGALYVDNKVLRSDLKSAQTDKATAEGRVNALTTSLRAEEKNRADEVANLVKKQQAESKRINANWTAKVSALSGSYKAQLAMLEGNLHAYITPVADSHCVIPVGALLYHDAAAHPADEGGKTIPAPASGSSDTDSKLHLSDVFAVIAGNYAGAQQALNTAVAEVAAWRDWYVAQRAQFQ